MPEKPSFEIDDVRAFAQRRVDETSLREVAAAVGMSHSGLFSFLQGGDPYSRNRQRLIEWYVRSRQTTTVRLEDVDAAVALLREYIYSGSTEEQSRRRAKEVTSRLLREGN